MSLSLSTPLHSVLNTITNVNLLKSTPVTSEQYLAVTFSPALPVAAMGLPAQPSALEQSRSPARDAFSRTQWPPLPPWPALLCCPPEHPFRTCLRTCVPSQPGLLCLLSETSTCPGTVPLLPSPSFCFFSIALVVSWRTAYTEPFYLPPPVGHMLPKNQGDFFPILFPAVSPVPRLLPGLKYC